jgi:hypothetical protein
LLKGGRGDRETTQQNRTDKRGRRESSGKGEEAAFLFEGGELEDKVLLVRLLVAWVFVSLERGVRERGESGREEVVCVRNWRGFVEVGVWLWELVAFEGRAKS